MGYEWFFFVLMNILLSFWHKENSKISTIGSTSRSHYSKFNMICTNGLQQRAYNKVTIKFAIGIECMCP